MKKNKLLLVWSLLLSAIFIGLASKSSPIYPLNDWVDVNCFFTMGRGILDGMVPYRDLYEQKGPVLYFVYAIIALFSRNSYVGVYLLEVLTFGLFLFFSCKLAQLYLGNSKLVCFIPPVLAAAVVTSWSFTHGGSVEQHSLFMLVYGMYSVLRALREGRGLTFKEAFLNGIFAGIVLWVKYTTLGFYLGLALFVLIWYLADAPLRKKLLLVIGQFLLGVAAVSSVVFLYFGLHGAIDDLFVVYFYNNIFLYAEKTSGSRIHSMLYCLADAIKYNINYGWMILAGPLLWKYMRSWKEGLVVTLCFLLLTVGTYWGGKGWDYYGFVFVAFCIFGLVALGMILQSTKLTQLWHRIPGKQILPAVLCMVLLLPTLLMSTLQHNQNMYLTKYEKQETAQYRFAETIKTVENPTLLNYGFLDGGFYYASGAKPVCRYFCYFNINTPEMWEDQKNCINNGDVDFVVTVYKLEAYASIGVDCSKYVLVDEYTHPYDKTHENTYYLYQKIT